MLSLSHDGVIHVIVVVSGLVECLSEVDLVLYGLPIHHNGCLTTVPLGSHMLLLLTISDHDGRVNSIVKYRLFNNHRGVIPVINLTWRLSI